MEIDGKVICMWMEDGNCIDNPNKLFNIRRRVDPYAKKWTRCVFNVEMIQEAPRDELHMHTWGHSGWIVSGKSSNELNMVP